MKREQRKSVRSSVYLNTEEADPAGEGQGARTRLKPGEQAGRGGTPSRPPDREPKPEYGHARNLCQKRPEGQHSANRWRWGGSQWVISLSQGTDEKPFGRGRTDNDYRGKSQRPLATLSGDSGRAYRRDLTSGAAYQTANVGGPTTGPEVGWTSCG